MMEKWENGDFLCSVILYYSHYINLINIFFFYQCTSNDAGRLPGASYLPFLYSSPFSAVSSVSRQTIWTFSTAFIASCTAVVFLCLSIFSINSEAIRLENVHASFRLAAMMYRLFLLLIYALASQGNLIIRPIYPSRCDPAQSTIKSCLRGQICSITGVFVSCISKRTQKWFSQLSKGVKSILTTRRFVHLHRPAPKVLWTESSLVENYKRLMHSTSINPQLYRAISRL